MTALRSAAESLGNMVETITVKPNTDYWVIVSRTANLFLTSLSLDPASIDSAGLDISLFATADPVLSLKPAFASANPEVVAALEFARLSTVPILTAPPLFATSLLGIVALGKKQAYRRPRLLTLPRSETVQRLSVAAAHAEHQQR